MKRFQSICVLLALLVAMPAGADEIKTLAGKTIKGTLEKITDGSIVLKEGDKSVTTPLSKTLDLTLRPSNANPAAAKYIEIQLLDESILPLHSVTFGTRMRRSN